MRPKVLVIVGQTATGKSDLAVRVAKKISGEVISADSRQVYKGLDAGTGKISIKDMQGISHHLISIVNPKKQFTVAEYKKLALDKIKQILEKQKVPIIAGGTGFYIDAVTKNMVLPEVPPNKSLRLKLAKQTTENLFELLEAKDPKRAKSIDPMNKVRLIRALEIIEHLGVVPEKKINSSPYNFVFIGIKTKNLDKQIYARLLSRVPGMIREGIKLRKGGLTWKRMEELGLEYRYLARYLQKKLTKEKFIEGLYSEIKKYSKRQMTWFKKNKKIKWLNSDSSSFDVLETQALKELRKPK